jgi:cobalamin biosynthetic protein CobC
LQGWTIHGGRLNDARRGWPDAPEPWLDLSTGINARAWPGAAIMEIDCRQLPDDGELDILESVAAEHFGVLPRHICALPGTEIGLRLLATVGWATDAYHVVPGYRTHAEAFSRSKPITATDLAAGPATVAARDRAVLLANPNNPDGRFIPAEELMRLARAMQEAGGWLIVDEAFADISPAMSIASHIGENLPLIVFRSFGKFFGLPGLRLGFVLGPERVIGQFRRLLGSWPVSTAALRIGAAAYRDQAWIAGMRNSLADDAHALDVVLLQHGYRPTGACPLFRLIETDDAAGLFERLAGQGILTRPFDYDPRWLRIGLPGNAAGLNRLDRALSNQTTSHPIATDG